MTVHSFWDFIGAVMVLALVATILSKTNTSSDLAAAGTAFSSVLTAAEAG